MDRLFNSKFENALRLLILLDELDMPQTIDTLYAADFMALYSKAFDLTETNLNGDNNYKFSEFASHRELVKEALIELVLNGTVEALGYKNGLSYVITPEGEDLCAALDSDYANEYRENARIVITSIAGKSERALIAQIYKLSKQSLCEEAVQ